MKAVIAQGTGGPEVLSLENVLDPKPQANEIIIATKAIGLNNADLLQRRGLYPPPAGASALLGLEVSGEVLEIGSEVTKWKEGDRVMALLSGGGYAEKVQVHEDLVMPIPESVDFIGAAGIPEAFLTAWLELVTLADLKLGETVLIHAGASGVGSAAIQVANELGASVFFTAGSDEKIKRCRELGPGIGINYKTESFDARVLAETDGVGVNCILDLVGAAHWTKNIRALAIEGRLLLVGLSGGSSAELDMKPLLSKRLRIIGSTLRARPLSERRELVEDFSRRAIMLFTSKRMRPVIDRTFPMKNIQEAHRYLEEQKNFGKVVLTV